jgi:PAS domain S-box-containing protein
MIHQLSNGQGRRRGTASAGRDSGMVQLDALFEHVLDGVALIARGGPILYASPSMSRRMAYARTELVGRPFLSFVHPDDRARVQRLESVILARSGGTAMGEFRFMHGDGSWRWLQGVCTNHHQTPGIEAVVVICRELPAQPTRQPGMDIVEGLYRILIENAVHITAVLNVDRTIRYVSPAVQRMLGHPPADLEHTSWFQLIHPDDVSAVQQRFNWNADISTVDHQLIEFRARHRDGSWRVLEAIASDRLADPTIAGIVVDARDVTERKWTADRLQHSLEALLAIHAVGRQLGSSIEQRAIAVALLEGARRVGSIEAGVILLRGARGELRQLRGGGAGPSRLTVRRARVARLARERAVASGTPEVFRLSTRKRRVPLDNLDSLEGLALPLRVQDRVIGILEVYGRGLASNALADELSILADQAAGALERTRLYRELAERERRLEDLVAKLVLAQDEERRRIAFELHDGLAQVAAAAQEHLEAFVARYRGHAGQQRDDLDRSLALQMRTVIEARRVIGGLRPTALDDFGLAAAIALETQTLQAEGWEVGYTENLGAERLPAAIETALFRVTQEALSNVRKHAGGGRVAVVLEVGTRAIHLEIRDSGRGFGPRSVQPGAGPGERVGLASMQERVALLGGQCVIRSRPGAGTRVRVDVPLHGSRHPGGQ